MFLIVEYVVIDEDETEVEVVPSSWYSSGHCWWPPGAFACSTLEKKVSKSVDCDKTKLDCYDGCLIATFSTYIIYCYTEIDFLIVLLISLCRDVYWSKGYVLGELVTPSSTDIDGHEKGKQAKQRTRSICYLGLNEDKVAFKSTTICEIVIGECLEHVFLLALIPSTLKVF